MCVCLDPCLILHFRDGSRGGLGAGGGWPGGAVGDGIRCAIQHHVDLGVAEVWCDILHGGGVIKVMPHTAPSGIDGVVPGRAGFADMQRDAHERVVAHVQSEVFWNGDAADVFLCTGGETH